MKAYGSGYFGEWIKGLMGVPAYLYTVNQLADPKAVTWTNPAWNDPRNHIFLIGNDRVVATCSNYGYIQVRQDENGPKYLNDYDPKGYQYGGGFGYLKGEELLSTYYNGQQMRREFGTGYLRKVTRGREVQVEEILVAPYGDDPVILKRVTVTNTSGHSRKFQWYDYFGGALYQFTFTHYCIAQLTFRTANTSKYRRRLDKRFKKSFIPYENGLAIKRSALKGRFPEGFSGFIAEKFFEKTAKRFYSAKNYRSFDDHPPETGYFCLSEKPAGMYTSAEDFFGQGGVLAPDHFTGRERAPRAGGASRPMFMLAHTFELAPGESKTLDYIYAYAPGGFDLIQLRDKYKKLAFNKVLEETLSCWMKERISVKLGQKEWVDRELIWHNAYLRGGMTYSDYFEAHILSQGGIYQYIMGLQGAARDQLQHALPFIYTEPYIAREHILFTLRQMSAQGELPYATQGKGMMVASVMNPSDLQLMLLAFAGEYVLATRDYAFLDTKYTCRKDGEGSPRTVLEGLLLAWRYLREVIGLGEHELVRMLSGDWNDQVVYGRVPFTGIGYVKKHGESTLNSALATYAVNIFAEMLFAVGLKEEAGQAALWADRVRAAVRKQWTGQWFRRAFLGQKLGWYGEERLWLEPQPWAIIGGAADREQAEVLAGNIKELLCDTNPNGASLMAKPAGKREDCQGIEEGTLENGGIWPAINGYLVWALAKVDEELAYREWLRNSRAAQAEAYPEIWYGIWSGPDSINASYAKFPGRTQNSRNPYTGKREKFFKFTVGLDWEDFPVLNLHAHTWQQYTIFKLLGVEFSRNGIYIAPSLPEEEYVVSSPLLSVSKKDTCFQVSYNPQNRLSLKMSFYYQGRTPQSVRQKGREVDYEMKEGRCEFTLSDFNDITLQY